MLLSRPESKCLLQISISVSNKLSVLHKEIAQNLFIAIPTSLGWQRASAEGSSFSGRIEQGEVSPATLSQHRGMRREQGSEVEF